MRFISILTIVIFCFSLFVLPSSAQVSNGAIPEAALSYFEGVILKLPQGQDYFLYRSGDYTTNLITSEDLKLDGSVVSGTSVKLYQYNTRGSSNGNYNYYPEFTVTDYDTFMVNTDTFSIAYSSLGDWSELIARDQGNANIWIKYIAFTLILAFLVFLALKFFKYRRSYISL